MGRAFGFHRALDSLGAILGPLVAYFILRAHPAGFPVIFITAFLAGILAVLTIFFVNDVVGEVQKKNISLSSLSVFSADFKRYLAALLFLSLGSIPVAVLLLKTQSIGLALSSIPLFYLLYNCSYAGVSFSAGSLSDRIGPRKSIILGYVLLLVSYIVLAFAESIPFLVLGFLVLGLFSALTDGVQRAFASELSSEERRGSAIGSVNAISGIGFLLAGIGGGYVWQEYGLVSALALAGVLVLIGLTILTSGLLEKRRVV